MLPIIAGVLLVGINATQIWDRMRVQKMLRSGDGVRITQGSITDSWHPLLHQFSDRRCSGRACA